MISLDDGRTPGRAPTGSRWSTVGPAIRSEPALSHPATHAPNGGGCGGRSIPVSGAPRRSAAPPTRSALRGSPRAEEGRGTVPGAHPVWSSVVISLDDGRTPGRRHQPGAGGARWGPPSGRNRRHPTRPLTLRTEWAEAGGGSPCPVRRAGVQRLRRGPLSAVPPVPRTARPVPDAPPPPPPPPRFAVVLGVRSSGKARERRPRGGIVGGAARQRGRRCAGARRRDAGARPGPWKRPVQSGRRAARRAGRGRPRPRRGQRRGQGRRRERNEGGYTRRPHCRSPEGRAP